MTCNSRYPKGSLKPFHPAYTATITTNTNTGSGNYLFIYLLPLSFVLRKGKKKEVPSYFE
jgi:hypothetical protein